MKTAITGGIGSGKSHVCQLLKQQGIEIYDCDSAAKRLMRTSDTLKEQLKRLVGDEVYIDGNLNKPMLAQFLLAGEENKKSLERNRTPGRGTRLRSLRNGMDGMCDTLRERFRPPRGSHNMRIGSTRIAHRQNNETRRDNTRQGRKVD